MEPIRSVEGPIAKLHRHDVDTDQIMPKQFLKRVERTGFGQFLFHHWAQHPDWELPPHPILATGRNFGCGSSREHAPWGLQDYGFRAIIAPSFADIFYSNCTKIGLLPVVVAEQDLEHVMAAEHARIHLETRTVELDERTLAFHIDDDAHHRLLNGLDDIGITLQYAEHLDAYERERERPGPVTTSL